MRFTRTGKTTIIAFALAIATLAPLAAQQRSFGLGVILGEPTGLSAKMWLGDQSAIDLAAAWSFVGQGAFYFHADYLHHFFDVFPVNVGTLPLYVGVGARVTLESIPIIGLRVPFGIAYIFKDAPIELFLEIAPGLALYPATAFDGSGGIGVRFYF